MEQIVFRSVVSTLDVILLVVVCGGLASATNNVSRITLGAVILLIATNIGVLWI
jgi:hypothetical protein